MIVTYEDHCGDDLKVVNMARVSFGKRSKWVQREEMVKEYVENGWGYPEERTGILSKPDQSLIAFLARGCTSGDWDKVFVEVQEAGHTIGETVLYQEGGGGGNLKEDEDTLTDLLNHIKKMPSHWTPFGHCQVTLHMKVPLFVARQIHKHQVGFVVNEVSRRYVTDEPEFYVPEVWRKAADNVKQGSSDEEVEVPTTLWQQFGYQQGNYEELLELGVCPEQARMVLPQSMYTEFFMTGSLMGWANMYNQRSDPHAQKEVQEVAQQIQEIIQPLYKYSWKELTR